MHRKHFHFNGKKLLSNSSLSLRRKATYCFTHTAYHKQFTIACSLCAIFLSFVSINKCQDLRKRQTNANEFESESIESTNLKIPINTSCHCHWHYRYLILFKIMVGAFAFYFFFAVSRRYVFAAKSTNQSPIKYKNNNLTLLFSIATCSIAREREREKTLRPIRLTNKKRTLKIKKTTSSNKFGLEFKSSSKSLHFLSLQNK